MATRPIHEEDTASADPSDPYRLDDQVGYMLRLASQRHAMIFQEQMIDGLTPTQFAMLIRLGEVGQGSQNQLGRLTAMDVATAKGVVDRLKGKGLIRLSTDEKDGRRHIITLSAKGQRLLPKLRALGKAITEETLKPLDARAREALLRQLNKLA